MIILLNFNSNTKLDNGVTCKANSKQNEIRRNVPKQTKNKRKQKQTKSQSYNKWAYQHVGLISESNMKSSQHVFCNIIGSKYYSSA